MKNAGRRPIWGEWKSRENREKIALLSTVLIGGRGIAHAMFPLLTEFLKIVKKVALAMKKILFIRVNERSSNNTNLPSISIAPIWPVGRLCSAWSAWLGGGPVRCLSCAWSGWSACRGPKHPPPTNTPKCAHVVCFIDLQLAGQRRGHVLGGFLSARPPKPLRQVELPNNHTSLYSSVAERQSCKLKVLGSIPSGGFCAQYSCGFSSSAKCHGLIARHTNQNVLTRSRTWIVAATTRRPNH